MKIIVLDFKSSNIESFWYEDDSKMLHVRFRNESLYRYSEVPQDIFYNFMESESKGKYFNKNIRTSFKYEKV